MPSATRAPRVPSPMAVAPAASAVAVPPTDVAKPTRKYVRKPTAPTTDAPVTTVSSKTVPAQVVPTHVVPAAVSASASSGTSAETQAKARPGRKKAVSSTSTDTVATSTSSGADAQSAPAPKGTRKASVPKLDADGNPVVKTRRKERPLVSPRSVHGMLVASQAAKGGLTHRELRQSSDTLGRHIIKLVNGALQITKAKKAVTVGDREMTSDDLREAARLVAKSIRRFPVKSRSSAKSKETPLSQEERDRRIAVLKERVVAGVGVLMDNVKNPHINIEKVKQLLIRNEFARLDADPRPSKVDAGAQISAAIYMSDQFVEFVKNANFGNGLTFLYPGVEFSEECQAESDKEKALAEVANALGRDPSAELGGRASALALVDARYIIAPLLIKERIARPPLLMSLMSRYVSANRLKADSTRVRLNGSLKKFFGGDTDTRWYLGGELIPPSEEKADEPQHLSGLSRLLSRPPKVEGGPVPFDGETMLRPMLIALASMYRISKVSEEREEKLKSQYVKDLTVGLKAYL